MVLSVLGGTHAGGADMGWHAQDDEGLCVPGLH